MQNFDFISIYDALSELYEAKNNNKNKKAATSQGPTFSDHIESICTPLSDIIHGAPKEKSGFLLYASPKFIDQLSEFRATYPATEIDKLQSTMCRSLEFLTNSGVIIHKDLCTEPLNSVSDCDWGWRLGKIAGTPVRSHVILPHDNVSGNKYFIVSTLFLHRREKWTQAENTMGNSEYDKIYSFYGKQLKKTS